MRAILSAHQFEHRVGPALQRYVEMGHEGSRRRGEINDFVGEQVGLDRGDAVALDTLYGVEGPDKSKEILACGWGEAVGAALAEVADVHPGDHDLPTPFGRHGAGLTDEVGDGGRARAAAGRGYGAVGTPAVASVLNLEEVARAVAAGARGGEHPYILGGYHLPARGPVGEPAVEVFEYEPLLVVSGHDGHAVERRGLVGFELGVAPGEDNRRGGVAAVERAHRLAALFVGLLGYAA